MAAVGDFNKLWKSHFHFSSKKAYYNDGNKLTIRSQRIFLGETKDNFFDEGCKYNLELQKCAIQTVQRPNKCMEDNFRMSFVFLESHPTWLTFACFNRIGTHLQDKFAGGGGTGGGGGLIGGSNTTARR